MPRLLCRKWVNCPRHCPLFHILFTSLGGIIVAIFVKFKALDALSMSVPDAVREFCFDPSPLVSKAKSRSLSGLRRILS